MMPDRALLFFVGQAEVGAAFSLWDLFWQSFDLFTVLIVAGSLVGVFVMVRAVLEQRPGRIAPTDFVDHARNLIDRGRLAELRSSLQGDRSVTGVAVSAALDAPGNDASSVRLAAEMAAGARCSEWMRRIEPLAWLGQLGPLIGLAGTVWGMVLAFASLGSAGGMAGPTQLSEGISKALFHTLLGLLLAIPSIVAFSLLRSRLDKLCSRALLEAGDLVDRLPAESERRRSNNGVGGMGGS